MLRSWICAVWVMLQSWICAVWVMSQSWICYSLGYVTSREQTKVGFRVPERNQEVQNSPKRVPERNQEVQNSPKRVPERNQERNR